MDTATPSGASAPTPKPNPDARTIVDHLLQEAARRARWCGNSQDFLTYATAVSMLAATRQALQPGPSFSVAPEVVGERVPILLDLTKIGRVTSDEFARRLDDEPPAGGAA